MGPLAIRTVCGVSALRSTVTAPGLWATARGAPRPRSTSPAKVDSMIVCARPERDLSDATSSLPASTPGAWLRMTSPPKAVGPSSSIWTVMPTHTLLPEPTTLAIIDAVKLMVSSGSFGAIRPSKAPSARAAGTGGS